MMLVRLDELTPKNSNRPDEEKSTRRRQAPSTDLFGDRVEGGGACILTCCPRFAPAIRLTASTTLILLWCWLRKQLFRGAVLVLLVTHEVASDHPQR